MQNWDVEHEHLFEAIRTSDAFKRSPDSRELLQLLYYMRACRTGVPQKYIASLMNKTPGSIGVAMNALRNRLEEYSSAEGVNEKWTCTLPPGSPGEGYRLEFSLNPSRKSIGTFGFWQAHMNGNPDVLLIYNQLLFFADRGAGYALRFFDVNVENEDRAADELSRLHPTPPRLGSELVCWSRVQPCYWYEGAGEVEAADHLLDWFRTSGVTRVRKLSCRHARRSDVLRSSPVMIGSELTHPLMRRVMTSTACNHLRYRFADSEPSTLVVSDPSPDEQDTLAHWGASQRQGKLLLESTENTFFGVVSRIRNPGDPRHSITFLASYGTLVIEQMALALTDEPRVAEFSSEMEWRAIPSSFELLFAVQLGPGNLNDEAAQAQLIVGSSY